MSSSFKFLHCADLHLGSTVHAPGANDAIFQSLSRILGIAAKESADAVFISGDVYDTSSVSPSTRHRFVSMLAEYGGKVFIARGNHDANMMWSDAIPYPSNVHEFSTEPESLIVDCPGGQFEVVGASFAAQYESRDLTSLLRGKSDLFTVACVHCDIAGDARYAACDQATMRGRGVDYWALGHIHKRQIVSKDPYIVYPGNIQGRDFGETDEKGAYLVTVTANTVSGVEFVPTQSIRFVDAVIDISGKDVHGIVDDFRASYGPGDIARATFVGSGMLDAMLHAETENIVSTLAASSGAKVLSARVRTSPESSIGPIHDAISSRSKEMLGMSREEIISMLTEESRLNAKRSVFEQMTDSELYGIIEEAKGLAISALGGSR